MLGLVYFETVLLAALIGGDCKDLLSMNSALGQFRL